MWELHAPPPTHILASQHNEFVPLTEVLRACIRRACVLVTGLWETRLVLQLAHGVLTHHSGISLNHCCTYLNLKPVTGNWASLMAQMVKNLPAMQDTLVRFLGWEIPWRRDRPPTLVFLGFPGGQTVKNLPAMWEIWV